MTKKRGWQYKKHLAKNTRSSNVKIPENDRKESLKISVKEGSAYAVMDGLGNAYISPYAIALNASNQQIGLLSAVPNLVAPLAQLGTIRVMEKVASRKRIVITAVTLQAFMWLPILIIPFLFKSYDTELLILFFSLLAIFASFVVPVWTSWMGDLVKDNERGSYFGRRNKIAGIVALIVTFLGGMYLDLFKKLDGKTVFYGFATIFLISFIARLATVYYFKKQYEPKFKFDQKKYFSLLNFVEHMGQNNFGRFVIYVSVTHLVAYIAAPFFAVYMLKDLGFSYTTFTIISMSSSLATLISMPYWGRFGDKYGTIKLLRICGLLIFLVPLLWIFSSNLAYLFIIELISGIVWAGFNLAASNFLFDAVTREKRAICVAYSNILRGIGIFIGSLLGGWMATKLPITFMNKILFVFLISAALRIIVAVTFLPMIHEVRPVEKGPLERLIHYTPLQGRHGFLRGLASWLYTPIKKNSKQ